MESKLDCHNYPLIPEKEDAILKCSESIISSKTFSTFLSQL